MTDFTQDLISNGEEPKSMRILLEAQWPEMIGRVELGWLEFLAEGGKSKASIRNITGVKEIKNNVAEPARGKCEASQREGNDQRAPYITDHNADPSSSDLDMVRSLRNSYKEQRAASTKRRFESGDISRVNVEWCCHCQITTKFAEEKCVMQYCEHKRCDCCRNFNKVVKMVDDATR